MTELIISKDLYFDHHSGKVYSLRCPRYLGMILTGPVFPVSDEVEEQWLNIIDHVRNGSELITENASTKE